MSQSTEADNPQTKELRFELAWRWFALHSSQRVSMFNFFLVASGVLANAYVFLIINDLSVPAAFLGFAAAVVSTSFVLLDRRNRQLIKMGEDLLVHLEATELYTRGQTPEKGKTHLKGLLLRELEEGEPHFYMKHWFLIEGLEVLIAFSFFAGGIFALIK